MNIDPQLFERAAHAFNSVAVAKGQVVSIATCDVEGRPNVAPIGSMRVVDSSTVHVLEGFLSRTLHNLKQNPLAAFSVTLRFSVFSSISDVVRPNQKEVLGYRLYGKLAQIDESRALIDTETREIVKRAPWLFRKAFAGFCEKNLRRLLTFEVLDIRTT